MNTAQTIFNERFNREFDLAESELDRGLHDYEAEGLEVQVASKMLDEGLITSIDQVIR